MTKVVGIFTGKDLKMMESEGGSGYWVARSDRVKNAEYVILIRNRREQWAAKDGINHGQAFMVGKILDCISSNRYDGRKLIRISEYSLLPNTDNFKQAWKKLTANKESQRAQRYPVAYLTTDDLLKKLELDVSKLEWYEFKANPDAEKSLNIDEIDSDTYDEEKELHEVVFEAKEMIAHSAGVDIESISIQINF